MTLSARFLFERSRFFSETCDHERYRLDTLNMIDGSAKRVLDISCQELEDAAPGGPSPFGAHALYQAAVLNIDLARKDQNSGRWHSVKLLTDALQRINQRWRVAGMRNRVPTSCNAHVHREIPECSRKRSIIAPKCSVTPLDKKHVGARR